MSGDSFFTKVATRTERERVYGLLVEQKLPVIVVDEKKNSHRFIPKYLSGSKIVITAEAAEPVEIKAPVILNFSIGNEKYFLKALLREGIGRDYDLDMHNDLFKLQRRGSFRLNIPNGYLARIEIRSLNSQLAKIKFDLVDLSGGGFAFEHPSGDQPTFKAGDLLEVILTVGPGFQNTVRAVVRHVRMVGSRASGLCRIGCEFQNLSVTHQNELIKIVMDIHRDMFSKFKLGSM